MTKREARRSITKATPEQSARWKKALAETEAEKDEILKLARQYKAQDNATRAELARTAELLKSERESQGLSLADMQDRTGISRAALCRLENLVDANPTIATLNRIAEALGKQLVVGLVNK
jgi:DNA-binding XRE family transcriptional regulator